MTIDSDHIGNDAAENSPSDASIGSRGRLLVDEQGNPYTKKSNAYQELKHLISGILNRIPHGERLMILLTSIIALSTVAQMVISCNNNASTTKQVNRLLVAADRIDDAAESFSHSAVSMDKSMNDAVNKLNLQASETQSLVKTAQATYEAAERPYVGIYDAAATISAPGPDSASNGLLNITKIVKGSVQLNVGVIIKNYGVVPANNMQPFPDFRINGKKIEGSLIDRNPTELFPGETLQVTTLLIPGKEYQSLLNGKSILEGEIRVTYEYASIKYKYCERMQYYAAAAEMTNLGNKCGEPWAKGSER